MFWCWLQKRACLHTLEWPFLVSSISLSRHWSSGALYVLFAYCCLIILCFFYILRHICNVSTIKCSCNFGCGTALYCIDLISCVLVFLQQWIMIVYFWLILGMIAHRPHCHCCICSEFNVLCAVVKAKWQTHVYCSLQHIAIARQLKHFKRMGWLFPCKWNYA